MRCTTLFLVLTLGLLLGSAVAADERQVTSIAGTELGMFPADEPAPTYLYPLPEVPDSLQPMVNITSENYSVRTSPDSLPGELLAPPDGERTVITYYQYADQRVAWGGDVQFGECGTHTARISEGGDYGWVQWQIYVPTYAQSGTLQIGVEFWDRCGFPWLCGGPDLRVWNWQAGSWTTWGNISDWDEFAWIWKTPSNSNQHIDSDGCILFQVYCNGDDDTCVRQVGVKIDPIYPDLVVTDIWTDPTTFCKNTPVTIWARTANQGSGDVLVPTHFHLYRDGSEIAYADIPAMGSGDVVDVHLDGYVWPNDVSAHTIKAWIDPSDVIPETNNSNNYREESYTAKDVPAAPGGVSATDATDCNQVIITWNASTGATKYKIMRGSTVLHDNWPGSPYYDTGASPGTQYSYCVYAGNECGWSSATCDNGTRKAPPGAVAWVDASDGTSCSYTRVNWSTVSGATKYKITRGGSYLTEVSSPPYDDGGGSAGTTYSYCVYAGNDCGWSSYVCDNGYRKGSPAAASSVQASDGTYPDKVRITWSDNSSNEDGFKIYRDTQLIATKGAGVTSHDDTGATPGVTYNYCVVAYNNCGDANSACDSGYAQPYGVINGYVQTPGGVPVAGVNVCATPGNYCAQTNAQGNYSITAVPYMQGGTTYTVTPSLSGHTFAPPSQTVTLSPGSPTATCNFTDTSAFPVSGRVAYQGTSCPVAGIRIRVDGNDNPVIYTDQNGSFTASLAYGQHTITPVPADGHTFNPTQWSGTITGPLSGVDFADLLTRHLAGKVVGGCDHILGTAKVTITSSPSCFSTIVYTDAQTGSYSATLPPLVYTVAVEMVPPDPLITFDTQTVNLTQGDAYLPFVHHNPIEVAFENLPAIPSGCTVPILEQWQSYDIVISVFERYGAEICPVDSVEVTIYDEISDRLDEPATVMVLSGTVPYTLIPGEPNLQGGGYHPHQKQLEVAVAGEDDTFSQWAIVTGHKVREGTAFNTITPELPFLILRDPPGDMSFSSFAQSIETCVNTSLYFQAEGSVTLDMTAKIGLDLGIGSIGGEIGGSLEIGAGINSIEEFGLCLRSEETFATWTGDDIVGPDADLFVGAALNIEYQLTDVLSVDENCQVHIDPSIAYNGDGYKTVFIYKASDIRDDVIPRAQWLSEHTSDPDSIQIYLDSKALWEHMLVLNDSLKAVSPLVINRSFYGCTSYNNDQSTTLTEASMFEFYLFINAELAASAGIEILGSGGELGVKVKGGLKIGKSTRQEIQTTNTIAYHLEDDDCGDSFSVDIRKDPVYGTPVFCLLSGASSCPWEPPTQPRDGVTLGVDPNGQYNVPPEEAAEFTLFLGNTSATGEEREYCLMLLQESNPFGADIRVGGVPMVNPICYNIPGGTVRPQTMTVARGESAYEYWDLQMVLYAPCDPAQFADTVSFSVTFAKPCDAVDLFTPADGWRVNQASDDVLQVGVSGYDEENPDLQEVRFQYRVLPSGDWVTDHVFPRDELPADHLVFDWDVSYLNDGSYGIRAAAACTGGTSYSAEKQGVIDRQSPCLLGSPQPSDHILDPGDEISFTFNEPVDCGTVTPACASLHDVASGESVELATSCYTNRFVIDPTWPDYYLENRTLEAAVTCVTDLNGNPVCQPIEWQFLVDLGPVLWDPRELVTSVLPGESPVVQTVLRNRGPNDLNFTITGADICTASPTWGTLPRQSGSATISLQIHGDLTQGVHADTLYANIAGWPPEPFILRVTVGCAAPDWSVDPGLFLYNGSITAAIYDGAERIGGPGDLLGAFVGEQCRGAIEGMESQAGGFVFPLTVFSNVSQGESLTFRFYRAQDCTICDVTEAVPFVPDMIEGTMSHPYPLHIQNLFQVEIALRAGWNWFSLNILPDDTSLDSILSTIDGSADYIKNQTQYAQYEPGTGWDGLLTDLCACTMYMIHMTQADTLTFDGRRCAPDAPLVLRTGWNWIPFLPADPMEINAALATISPNGIYIKSQTQYAQYEPGFGWDGLLTTLRPWVGYKLKMAAPDTLIYPAGRSLPSEGLPALALEAAPQYPVGDAVWSVCPPDYDADGSVTAAVLSAGENVIAEGDVLGAFVGGVCRGVTQARRELSGKYLFHLTVYTNDAEGEQPAFRFYDKSRSATVDLRSDLIITPDAIHGRPSAPVAFAIEPVQQTLSAAPATCTFGIRRLHPNPARGCVEISFGLEESGPASVEILDLQGRVVRRLVQAPCARGLHDARWDGVDETGASVHSGIYYCRVTSSGRQSIGRLVIVR